MTTLTKKKWTEKALLALPRNGIKYELVDGELTSRPPRFLCDADVISSLSMYLSLFAREHKCGRVLSGQVGIWMQSGNMLSPNLSFMTHAQIEAMRKLPPGLLHGAPALVIEVLFPNETCEAVRYKLIDYFESGAQLAWVINTPAKTVIIFHGPDEASKVCKLGESLSGEDVVPGFKLPLKKLFEFS